MDCRECGGNIDDMPGYEYCSSQCVEAYRMTRLPEPEPVAQASTEN